MYSNAMLRPIGCSQLPKGCESKLAGHAAPGIADMPEAMLEGAAHGSTNAVRSKARMPPGACRYSPRRYTGTRQPKALDVLGVGWKYLRPAV